MTTYSLDNHFYKELVYGIRLETYYLNHTSCTALPHEPDRLVLFSSIETDDHACYDIPNHLATIYVTQWSLYT